VRAVASIRRARCAAAPGSRPAGLVRGALLGLALLAASPAAQAATDALQNARDSMMNSATDGGLARALAYCVFHAPAFDTLLADAASDGMSASPLADGTSLVLSPTDFPGAQIQVHPLADGTASCLAWSASARATDADQAVDDAVGFYLAGGRPEKVAASPSDYVFRDLPFAARLRAFAVQDGHGATFEVSGLAPQQAGLLHPVPPEAPARTAPATAAEAAPQGAVYDFEFLLGTGCALWLPDLRSAMAAMDRANLPMAKNANTYFYTSQFGGVLQLTEGAPGQIADCSVMNSIPLATANDIVRRTLGDADVTFREAPHEDGTAQWTGTLAPHRPGDAPTPFTAQTFFEPRQAEVTASLRLGAGGGQ
jgi:hypothetical protein